jgi:hypothetical protein
MVSSNDNLDRDVSEGFQPADKLVDLSGCAHLCKVACMHYAQGYQCWC